MPAGVKALSFRFWRFDDTPDPREIMSVRRTQRLQSGRPRPREPMASVARLEVYGRHRTQCLSWREGRVRGGHEHDFLS